MARRYGKKASEKIARTMHEFKRGKLRSGGGRRVTSREQAVAIGLSQARRAGYKVPPPATHGHAAMNLDARVRSYLAGMQPGQEIDARGIARALGGGVDPLEADYALARAQRAGLAVTSDGRWFGPALRGGRAEVHARKKTPPGQLDREIAAALARPAGPAADMIQLKDRYSGDRVWLKMRDGRVVGVMGADPKRYLGLTLEAAQHYARYGGHAPRSHATIQLDRDDARSFGRYARRMEQTRAQALDNARAEGFGAHQLAAVGEGWDAERQDTIHGGFPGTSHAMRRQAARKMRAPRTTPYRIKLTPDELRAVEFARGRYAWPDMLAVLAAEDGSVAFTESEMWQWVDDVDSDAGSGHFPLASGALAAKLQRFYDSRV